MDPHDSLNVLPREVAPPAALRSRVLRGLRARGLVAGRSWSSIALRAAAALGLFVGGVALGRGPLRAAPAAGEDSAASLEQFALLLYEPETFDASLSHEVLAREYGQWAASLDGRFVSGEALGEARVLGGAAPPMEPTGFFLVRAASYAEAVALARDCPHLRHGGVVSVRTVPST